MSLPSFFAFNIRAIENVLILSNRNVNFQMRNFVKETNEKKFSETHFLKSSKATSET